MSGAVIKNLSGILNMPFMDTCRRQLDWERSSLVEYDDDTEREIEDKVLGETERVENKRDISHVAASWQTNPSRFRFFMDGSRRTFRIADIILDSRCFPVVAGQVGVCVCERQKGSLSVFGNFRMHYVLALPLQLDTDGKNEQAHNGFFNNKLRELNEKLAGNGHSFKLDRLLFYNSKKEDNAEDKAISVIQSYMIEQEKNTVNSLVQEKKCLGNGIWLLKDGSLEYAKLSKSASDQFPLNKIKNNYHSVVGVSKSFNPELARFKNNHSASSVIANLPVAHRTPVFRYSTPRSDGIFAVWYLRLRKNSIRGPFDGVVKIEKLLITEEEKLHGLPSGDVDRISAWIFNERNPVCYGKDERWANHLYPIYLTEYYIKSRFLSTEHFINLF